MKLLANCSGPGPEWRARYQRRSNDALPATPAKSRFVFTGRSVHSRLPLHDVGPGNVLRRNALESADCAGDGNGAACPIRFDKPLPVRYASWLRSVIHGEMGFSFAYNGPVAPLLLVRARNTLLLTIIATLLAWGIALPLGVWSADRLGRLPDRLLSWATAGLLVIPDLAVALGLLVLAVRSGWFPTGGIASVDFETLSLFHKLRDLALHMILPVTALV